MRRRTLYRALAIALALVAITPLFADAVGDSPQKKPRRHALQATGPQPR